MKLLVGLLDEGDQDALHLFMRPTAAAATAVHMRLRAVCPCSKLDQTLCLVQIANLFHVVNQLHVVRIQHLSVPHDSIISWGLDSFSIDFERQKLGSHQRAGQPVSSFPFAIKQTSLDIKTLVEKSHNMGTSAFDAILGEKQCATQFQKKFAPETSSGLRTYRVHILCILLQLHSQLRY